MFIFRLSPLALLGLVVGQQLDQFKVVTVCIGAQQHVHPGSGVVAQGLLLGQHSGQQGIGGG